MPLQAPLVSFITPVHNRASFVGDAITSALRQTVADIEVVVVDDGSTDASVAIVEGIGDPRIRIVRHVRNLGIPAARNSGLAAARGRFIAWLDSDDVARPDRIAIQLGFLERNPSIVLVGSAAGKLEEDGTRRQGKRIPPLAPDDIKAWLLFRSAFQHSSVTGRSDVLKSFRFNEDFPVCEDTDMFIRLAEQHRLANLPRALIDRRVHRGQTVRSRQATIMERKTALAARTLQRLDMAHDDEDLRRHALLGQAKLDPSLVPLDFLPWADGWLRRLREANRRAPLFDAGSLRFATSYFFLLACRATMPRHGRAAPGLALLRSPLARDLATNRRCWAWLRQAVPELVG